MVIQFRKCSPAVAAALAGLSAAACGHAPAPVPHTPLVAPPTVAAKPIVKISTTATMPVVGGHADTVGINRFVDACIASGGTENEQSSGHTIKLQCHNASQPLPTLGLSPTLAALHMEAHTQGLTAEALAALAQATVDACAGRGFRMTRLSVEPFHTTGKGIVTADCRKERD
ncbi:MAG: hypothetical protein WAX89_03430 [Alphaproteobacteria bacterium]